VAVAEAGLVFDAGDVDYPQCRRFSIVAHRAGGFGGGKAREEMKVRVLARRRPRARLWFRPLDPMIAR
jgi:hypothetical protein